MSLMFIRQVDGSLTHFHRTKRYLRQYQMFSFDILMSWCWLFSNSNNNSLLCCIRHASQCFWIYDPIKKIIIIKMATYKLLAWIATFDLMFKVQGAQAKSNKPRMKCNKESSSIDHLKLHTRINSPISSMWH